MTDTETLPPRTHNRGPIIPPTDVDLRGDLENRYPEIGTELSDIEAALTTFPEKIDDEEVASALQDNLAKLAKLKTKADAHRKVEKKIWDSLAKVVQNFFTKTTETIDGHLETWKPRLQKYADMKVEAERRRQEDLLEAQRLETERLQREAEEKAMDAVWAEARVELAEYDERKARERAAEEERKRKEAEARAEAARAEERRIADERKAKEREERERNAAGLRDIKRYMKTAENIHTLAEADEATDDELKELDGLVKPGGVVSAVAGPIASSLLLDEEQQVDVNALKDRLSELRKAQEDRFGKREKARREKARLAEELAERERAEALKRERAAQEAREKAAREERERHQAVVDAAKAAEQKAKAEAKDHREAGKEAGADVREASRDLRQAERQADRATNVTDRMERKADKTTDAELSRTRGDLGSVGSKSGRWKHYIDDEAALRAICGPLGEHFTEEALSGAVYQWMVAHRSAFTGERVVTAELPGVVFAWEDELVIRS
jgi:hypothetical protein